MGKQMEYVRRLGEKMLQIKPQVNFSLKKKKAPRKFNAPLRITRQIIQPRGFAILTLTSFRSF